MGTLVAAKSSPKTETPSDPTSAQPSQMNEGVKSKLENFSPVGQADLGKFELADIVDVTLLQSLVNDFNAVAKISTSIIDMRGRVLVSVGWQHICTDFHRVHPDTCKNCIESDTILTAGIAPGEFKLYKCKNNMWDMATPLMVANEHVGNIFSGQFVFDDEPLDTEFFRAQAQCYGFEEEQYLAALAAVPRLNREHLKKCMSFLTKLAHMISQNGYNTLVAAAAQKSLAHLASFPELNPNPIFETDLEGKITYLNPAAQVRFPKLAETAVLVGWPSIVEFLRSNHEQSTVREVEVNGATFHQQVQYIPERAIVRSYTVDITERKLAEQALIRSEKLASVGRMAAVVTHEINNPLTAVTNYIYLAASNPKLPADVKELLASADREVKQISDIARRTLGFCRENADPCAVDIPSLVDEVVEVYRSKFRSKDIHLAIEHDGCGQVVAVGGQIRQVLSNLIVNAIDALSSNGTVTIRTSRVPLSGCTYTRITVADTGAGIPAVIRNRIFEPFFTTKGSLGTGLGLWVSHQIIEKHKGRIRVRSVQGKGTAFTVLLPECQAEDFATAIA